MLVWFIFCFIVLSVGAKRIGQECSIISYDCTDRVFKVCQHEDGVNFFFHSSDTSINGVCSKTTTCISSTYADINIHDNVETLMALMKGEKNKQKFVDFVDAVKKFSILNNFESGKFHGYCMDRCLTGLCSGSLCSGNTQEDTCSKTLNDCLDDKIQQYLIPLLKNPEFSKSKEIIEIIQIYKYKPELFRVPDINCNA